MRPNLMVDFKKFIVGQILLRIKPLKKLNLLNKNRYFSKFSRISFHIIIFTTSKTDPSYFSFPRLSVINE